MTHFRHASAYYQVMFNTDEQFLFYNFIMILERNKGIGHKVSYKNPIPKDLYLVLFISFSVVSAISPIMVKVSDTYI